jgi:hypothetical protein
MSTELTTRKLPAITDLYNEAMLDENDRRAQLNVLLNQPPAKSWVKEHPNITGYKYLPIERVEYLLSRVFIDWHSEVRDVKLIANSVAVTVRLYVIDPITGGERWQDGVGASPLQTNKGSGAVDFNALKSSAVMMALPAAETFAIKDAAEKFGKLFGKDLNRKDNISYDLLGTTFDHVRDLKEAKDQFNAAMQRCKDELLIQSVVDEVMEAERAKVATADFYARMTERIQS